MNELEAVVCGAVRRKKERKKRKKEVLIQPVRTTLKVRLALSITPPSFEQSAV
jgi:hypothetical protein